MSAADRLDKIESRLYHTSYHRHKGDVSALVAALRAVLTLADRWATQSTDYDEDTEQQIDDGKAIVRAIEEALA